MEVPEVRRREGEINAVHYPIELIKGRNMRFSFGEVALGPRGPALALHGWGGDHNTLVIGLIAFTLYLHIPQWVIEDYDMDRAYGFSFADTGLHLNWGKRTKVLWYPWSWEFYKRWELVAGDSYARGREFWVELPGRMNHGNLGTKSTAPYVYKLRSGEQQNVTATYYAEHAEWRWRWLQWLPWPRKTSTCICVQFSEEVGEGRGSWKGGTLGCGYELKPGESPLECLRRMERERTFSR